MTVDEIVHLAVKSINELDYHAGDAAKLSIVRAAVVQVRDAAFAECEEIGNILAADFQKTADDGGDDCEDDSWLEGVAEGARRVVAAIAAKR